MEDVVIDVANIRIADYDEATAYKCKSPQPVKDFIEKKSNELANGKQHCVICGDLDELVYVKAIEKILCEDCFHIQLNMNTDIWGS